MNCVICKRKSDEKYCGFHKEAYNNILRKYVFWKRAKEISWKEYLKEVVEISYTGIWAKEVVEYLLENKD